MSNLLYPLLTAPSDRCNPVKHGEGEAESRSSTRFSIIRHGLSCLTQAIYTEFLPYVYPRD